MSVLYRAVWNDDRAELVDGAMASFRAWVGSKSGGTIDVPSQGVKTGRGFLSRSRSPEDTCDAEARADRTSGSGDSSVLDVARAAYVELRPDGSRWTTTLRAWVCREPEDEDRLEGAQWLWVDVEAVTDGSLDGVVVAAPTLVRDLIVTGEAPHRRCVSMSTEPAEYRAGAGAEELADLLGHADRDIPVVVFSPSDAIEDGTAPAWTEIVGRATRSLAGMASVATVDKAASGALESILGSSYGVRDDSIRIYLPDLDPAMERDEWRHREIPPARFTRYPTTAAKLLARSLGPRAASRRAPRSYDAARKLLESGRDQNSAELLELLDLAEQESRQQRDRLALADDRYVDLLADHDAVLADLAVLREAALQSRVERERLLGTLRRHGMEEDYWTDCAQVEDGPDLPPRASNPSEAALLAQLYLSDHLDLPDEACLDLADLDGAVESSAWGQTAWQGFRALHAYAQETSAGVATGSFWTWCESSRHPLAWRATPKKLAMSESEKLKSQRRLWSKRHLPVSKDVHPSGSVHMEAHLKIAEGGGPLAPRIYFLHSPATGKVHVGFFGPHKHMPNTLT
jgi:hypothetical protein